MADQDQSGRIGRGPGEVRPDEIHNFINMIKQIKPGRTSISQYHDHDHRHATASYTTRQSSIASVAAASSALYDEHTASSVFDNSHTSERTGTEDPDRNEIPRDEWGAFHPPNFLVAAVTAATAAQAPVPPMTCEFLDIVHCTAQFRPDQLRELVDHTIGHFFQSGLPLVCLCWYCDRSFNADETAEGDKILNFEYRMDHTARCHEEESAKRGGRAPRRRLDTHIIHHLEDMNAISQHALARQRNRHEAPQIPGLLRYDERSPKQVRQDERNSRVFHDNEKDERRRRRKV